MLEESLQRLADKLNIGVDSIYDTLLVQASISAWTYVFFTISIWTIMFLYRYVFIDFMSEDSIKCSGNQYIIYIISCIFATIWSFYTISHFTLILASMFNPDYWALHELKSFIK